MSGSINFLEVPMFTTFHSFALNENTQLPAVGFGTYLIDPEYTADAVYRALTVGYRHIDTAAVYGNEIGVGLGIRKAIDILGLARKDIVVTTKLWLGYAAWGETPKSGAETMASFEQSLALMGLDYIDLYLYLIHSPHGGEQRIEQWKALLQLKQSGRIRSAGVSNFTQEQIQELLDAGLPAPDANQIELHPWSQKSELVEFMRRHKIAPIAYSSLAPLSTWRAEPGQDSAKTDELKECAPVFKTMAAKYGVSEAQLLLRWGV